VIDKYKEKRSLSNRFNQHKKNMTGSGTTFKKKDDFKLEEKVTAKSECIRLMQSGYLNAYVDLFYITSETTPSKIEPSEKLKEEYSLNKRTKKKFE
jgi:hypothetical protein